jgi:hypothetical protein
MRRKWRHLFRSSKTGRFVERGYAEHHPATTTEERKEQHPATGDGTDPVWPPGTEPGDRLPPPDTKPLP